MTAIRKILRSSSSGRRLNTGIGMIFPGFLSVSPNFFLLLCLGSGPAAKVLPYEDTHTVIDFFLSFSYSEGQHWWKLSVATVRASGGPFCGSILTT